MAAVDPALATLSATTLLHRFASGDLTPSEVHDAVQDAITAREPMLNALWQHDPEQSARAAAASTRRWAAGRPAGPLDGVPVTVKENLARAGVPMPAGTAAVDPVVPEHDSPVVARLLEAGAVIVGSTVMPDWGMLSSGVSSRHGVTRSPWDPAWTSGGSSAGAAVAAAGGYGPLHVGTDIGGSIRLPGTWLGLVTLKPSYGRVPLDAPYLGRVAGPMTRTVADAALLMSVLSRPDDRDYTALPPEEVPWSDLGAAGDPTPYDVHGLRVGLHLDAGCGRPAEPEVVAAVESAAAVFADAGARVEPLAPFLDDSLLDDLDLFLRVRSLADYEALPPERQQRLLPYVRDWCTAAVGTSGTAALSAYHGVMEMARRTVAATLPFDVVLSPVAPCPAFPAEQPMPYPDNGRGMQHIGFTAAFNVSGQPAGTVNAGFTADGRPLGVQLSGRRFADLEVLRAMAWLEGRRPAQARPQWPI